MIELCANCVKIVLTFDDGPDVSKTPKVKNTLHEKGKIIAAFFVQTHVSYRMGSEGGRKIVKELYDAGHMIGIHTGSRENLPHTSALLSKYPKGEYLDRTVVTGDHTFHTDRYQDLPYDINSDGVIDGENGLECDLQAAKAAIKQITGAMPIHVRATGGKVTINKSHVQVFSTYQKYDLSHACWNVDSYDSKGKQYGTKEVTAQLQSNIKSVVGKGRRILVILFHDTDDHTPNDLAGYIDTINNTVTGMGLLPEYTKSRAEIEAIFSVSNQSQWDENICSGVQKLIVYYVQAGVYTDPEQAVKARTEVQKDGYTNATVRQEGANHKLWIGPYENRADAEREEPRIRAITRDNQDKPPKKEAVFPLAAVIEREQ